VVDPLRLSSRSGRWVVAATVLGSAMAGIDATVVGIALPRIGKQFGVGLSELQWISNAYTLALAGLLLLGGALGDRVGRRRMFQVGTIGFAAASLVCGLAPSAPVLIAARGVQGLAAALLTPASLAILQASFAPDDRSRAIGAWSGLGGVAMAVGPFLGGWMIGSVSWRLIFFINLPVAAATLAVSARHVPESRDPGVAGSPLDLAGALLVSVGLTGLAYGLTEGASQGWSAGATTWTLVAGAAGMVAFVAVERRSRAPLVPLRLLRSRQLTGTNAVTFVVYGGLGGALFLLPVELQEAVGYSPVAAGTALLPVTAIMLMLSARSGALAARIGPRAQMSLGPVMVGAGLALLARIGPGSSYLRQVLPAVVVLGLGLAVTVAPLTAAALAAAPSEHSGLASALNNDVARAGGLFAVAVLPAVAGIHGYSYLHPLQLTAGFHTAVVVAGAACAAGGLLAWLTIRNPRRPAPPVPAAPAAWQCPLDAPTAPPR
jgi:EmrB/QacA subfamily drug resistance transporter